MSVAIEDQIHGALRSIADHHIAPKHAAQRTAYSAPFDDPEFIRWLTAELARMSPSLLNQCRRFADLLPGHDGLGLQFQNILRAVTWMNSVTKSLERELRRNGER